EHTGVVAHQRDAAKAVGLEGLDFNRVAWHGGIVGSARRSMPLPMPLILILILILTSGAPPKRRSRRTRPAGRRAWMRGVFRAGRMPARKIPPAPRTRCAASGAKAGCAFFAPGFFAQAKKGGSRRHGAKAFDLVRLPPVIRKEQEQLAALAPLIRRFAPPSPAGGRRAEEAVKTRPASTPRHFPARAAPIAPTGSPRTTPPAAASTRPRTSNRTPGAC